MSDYGKMQECWVIFRCTHTESVDGMRVRCPVTARRNAFRGAVYHRHGAGEMDKVFMEPVALAMVAGEGVAGGARVEREPLSATEQEAVEANVRGYDL